MSDAVSERYKEALRRGHVAVVKGRPREAVKHYEEAGSLVADRPLPFVSMGTVYLQMRQPREAIAAFDEALRRSPSDREALRGKAQALEAEGHGAEAAELARRASELDAIDQASQRAERARAAASLGMERHIGEAVRASRAGDRAAAIGAFMAAAQGYLAQGAGDAAFDAALRALEVDPGALNVHLMLVDMYLRRGWIELAVQRLLLIEHRLQVDPFPGARNALGEMANQHRQLDPRIERLASSYS